MFRKSVFTALIFLLCASQAMSNDVVKTQKMLNQLGYNAGPVDGAYGGKTKRALEAFYAKSGGSFDGKLDANEITDLTSAMDVAGLDLRVVHENLGIIVQNNSNKPYVISQPMKTNILQLNG